MSGAAASTTGGTRGITSRLSPTGIAPVLQVHPSRRCNLACAHCYSSSGPNVREELDAGLLADCLRDAADLGYRQLAVSGGEPLLYGSLGWILVRARALGMLTSITTNGMLITRANWTALAPLLDVVAISIDGVPAEHDRMRGRAGACARTLANLEIVRASGVPFGVIFTLTQHNVDSLDPVVRMAAAHGARSIQVHPLTMHGRAATALPDARPDGMELSAALCEAVRLGDELDVVVHVDAVTVAQLVEYPGHFVPRRPVQRLVDVAPVLVVEADGSVMPLTHEVSRALRLGSLFGERLSSLARDWLAAGTADLLADACERTWAELTMAGCGPAAYWYDEVAARTGDHRPTPHG
jgi:MoaA/NifB/PqqE/SkfB family radical SAM enzyme